jgi:trigger factor
VVEIRPQITVGGYESLRVTIPGPAVDDADVDRQVDQLRERFASLETVSREAVDGDHVVVDIHGTQDGESLDGLSADDYSYEVGSGGLVPELDENLRGTKAGDILEFDAEHPDPDEDDLAFRVLVKEVQSKVLPDPDDGWAAEASEFDTIAELRADLEERASRVKIVQAQMAVREKAADALAELVDDDIPAALVDGEVQNRLQDLAMRLSAQGATVEQYLEATGQDQETVLAQLREAAEPAVRIDLALRAVAEAEDLEADEDDLASEIAGVAERVDADAETVRGELERGGQISALRSDIRKRKALEWLVERVEIVDEDGEPVDRSALELPPDDDENDNENDAEDGAEPESGGPVDRAATAQTDTDTEAGDEQAEEVDE